MSRTAYQIPNSMYWLVSGIYQQEDSNEYPQHRVWKSTDGLRMQ